MRNFDIARPYPGWQLNQQLQIWQLESRGNRNRDRIIEPTRRERREGGGGGFREKAIKSKEDTANGIRSLEAKDIDDGRKRYAVKDKPHITNNPRKMSEKPTLTGEIKQENLAKTKKAKEQRNQRNEIGKTRSS